MRRFARFGVGLLAGLLLAGGCAPPEAPEEPFWNQELLLRIYLDGLTMIHPELTLESRLNTPADQQSILDDIELKARRVRELDLPPEPLPDALRGKLDRLLVRRLQDYFQRSDLQPSRAEVEQYYQEHQAEFDRPLEEVARRIQGRLYRQRVQEQDAKFYEEATAGHDLEILFDESLSEAPPVDSPVYRLDGKTSTYREVLSTHSNVYGDRTSADFFRVIVKRAIRSELLFGSPEADRLRQSREYRFLREALVAQWRAYQFLSREYEKNPVTEEELRQFYEDHREELYRAPKEVKLIVVSLPRASEQGPGAAPSATEAAAARENLARVRQDLIASASPATFSFAPYPGIPRLRTTRLEEWTPVSRLGSSIEMDIAGRGPGYTSSILVERWGHLFYHLLDRRRERPYRPFSEVREEIEGHLRRARQEEIRQRFGFS